MILRSLDPPNQTKTKPGCSLGDGDTPDPYVLVDAYKTFISGAYISGAHFVISRARALHHKLDQSVQQEVCLLPML